VKLYIIIRADLDPGAQLAQACHAAFQFGIDHKTVTDYWHLKSNNLVLLSVPNEATLKHLATRIQDAGLAHSTFREIDFDNAVTALALEPDGRRLVSNLPLALRKVVHKEAA